MMDVENDFKILKNEIELGLNGGKSDKTITDLMREVDNYSIINKNNN